MANSVADSSQRKVEFKHNTDLDRHSLFVKNVDYNASEEEIKRLFGKVRELWLLLGGQPLTLLTPGC